MKRTLLVLGAALMMTAGAQAQTGFGLKAGANLGKYSNFGSDQSINPSFYVTGYADLPVTSNFSIQPGVSLQGKGTKFKPLDSKLANVEFTRNVMSIEIPVNAVVYIPTGDAGKVFLGAGPYIGFNVSGKDKAKGNVAGLKGETSNTLKFSGSKKDLNLIDAGVNFMLGYKFTNGFLLSGGYNLGLTNLVPNATKDVSNRVWQFGVGLQF